MGRNGAKFAKLTDATVLMGGRLVYQIKTILGVRRKMLKPYYEDKETGITIYHGDCRDILPQLPKVDLVLTDPPYGINLTYASYIDSDENWYALIRWFIPQARAQSKMLIMPCCQIKKMGFFYREFEPDWIIAWYRMGFVFVLYGIVDWIFIGLRGS